jgi:Lrp/AsnC family transcriptional regulator for asnA, asnC and gidA
MNGLPRLTAADVRIIRLLQDDARTPLARIAARIGMPESTVRHRLNRLVREGVVQLTAVTNPFKLGYQIWAIIEVKVQPARGRAVAQRLAAAPQVSFVGLTTGNYDVLAAAVFRSNDELLTFLTRDIPAIPGVTSTSTATVLELLKRSVTTALPDIGENGTPRTPGRARRSRPGRRDRVRVSS